MTTQMKPLSCDPTKLSGLSEKLIASHYENNYGGAVKRLPVVFTDGFGDASYSVDLTSATLPTGTIAEGDIWNFQFWYRDPPGTLATFNLSDALSVPFCP